MKSFSSLQLPPALITNLEKMGFHSMTPVQEQTLPYILNSQDVIAQAKTGSGKTAAFGIGVLDKLDVKNFRIQTLVLCPTRELAEQVAKELRNIAKFQHNVKILTLCGGVAFGPQLGSLAHGGHIVVGTPGRILQHLSKGSLVLDNLKSLVLDEADRMLDMGFIEEMQKVISFAPQNRQTLLFSATFSDEVLELGKSLQKDAVSIKTLDVEVANKIEECFYEIEEQNKQNALAAVFCKYKPKNAIVFCNTKIESDAVAKSLQGKGIDALAIHGDLEQYDRVDILVQFANESARVLVATDVAARGLDIKELEMVVNYDFPHAEDTYTHRIGRTARAGEEGIAISFYTPDAARDVEFYKNETRVFEKQFDAEYENGFEMKPKNITLVIEGGKKDKLRAGDILGAISGEAKIDARKNVGKIDIYDRQSYVAIKAEHIDTVYNALKKGKIKTKKFSVWVLE